MHFKRWIEISFHINIYIGASERIFDVKIFEMSHPRERIKAMILMSEQILNKPEVKFLLDTINIGLIC